MKLAAMIARSLQADMQAELRDIERAVTTGTRDAGRGLKTELRRQVTSAGLGQRLANSWRDKHYPNQKLDAASLVYTKAPQIIRAFDEGAVIRSRRGRFLAIPTENAPRKGTDGRRISPSTFPEHRFGPLRFVPRPSGPSLLVDGDRATPRGARSARQCLRPAAIGFRRASEDGPRQHGAARWLLQYDRWRRSLARPAGEPRNRHRRWRPAPSIEAAGRRKLPALIVSSAVETDAMPAEQGCEQEQRPTRSAVRGEVVVGPYARLRAARRRWSRAQVAA